MRKRKRMYNENIYRTDFLACASRYVDENFNGQGELVQDFLLEMRLGGKKPITIYKYAKDLKFWLENLPEFRKCTLHDVRFAVARLQDMPVSEATRMRRKTSLKVFFRWLKNKDKPEETEWIKTHMESRLDIPPSLLLKPDDIKAMLSCLDTHTEKALLMLHWETGGRVGETLNVRIKDIAFEGKLAQVRVSGKTGPRPLWICESVPYLRMALDSHRNKGNPDAPAFLNTCGRRMSYSSFSAMLRRARALSGVAKPVKTHHFRHSRATYLASLNWTEPQLCVQHGWVPGSRMPGRYVHLAANDLKKKVMEMYGVANT